MNLFKDKFLPKSLYDGIIIELRGCFIDWMALLFLESTLVTKHYLCEGVVNVAACPMQYLQMNEERLDVSISTCLNLF